VFSRNRKTFKIMPSAANVKIDNKVSPESALPDSSSAATPLRQVITLVEHKIRNLEKRKSKLESYRDLQNAGKELNADQKTAVAKYNEVTQTLEFARDIYKQFLSIAVVSEKEAKKQAKKEAAAKNQAELARLREILLVQDALNQMGNEAVREDFLHGKNGAAQLTESELKLLDDLYPAVTPKHEAGNPTAFTNEVQAAAEHLLAVVDGKPKEVFGGTYNQVKEVLGKIHESGYFDQAPVSTRLGFGQDSYGGLEGV
jgi:caprin-1